MEIQLEDTGHLVTCYRMPASHQRLSNLYIRLLQSLEIPFAEGYICHLFILSFPKRQEAIAGLPNGETELECPAAPHMVCPH